MREHDHEESNTIKLAERRIFSQSFRPLYEEGMGLVEQAAEYLDGEGRTAARHLSRVGATLYAAESMRLTTRLMQVASWLLLQRAANSGEMTRDQVAAEKVKVRLDTASAQDDVAAWAELPEAFRAIVDHSLRLQALVRRMDEEIYGSAAAGQQAPSPHQTTRLMQVASWLLLQRAANSGEMTRDQVAAEKVKVRLDTASAQDDVAGWAELPEAFRAIVDHSLRLQALVRRMDEEIYGSAAAGQQALDPHQTTNPVSDQLLLLKTAFAGG